jgi:hypothetical protein
VGRDAFKQDRGNYGRNKALHIPCCREKRREQENSRAGQRIETGPFAHSQGISRVVESRRRNLREFSALRGRRLAPNA